ncbi:unnamed protein product [Rhodiola kirilowii]
MADSDHHHHHHRPNRLSVPPRSPSAAIASRTYFDFPYTPTPTPTPSKLRRLPSLTHRSPSASKSSLSFLFLLLFSLRSLYSLLPFLRSSPSFSLFPFTFLVSLFSFLLSLSFSAFSASSSYRDPFKGSRKQPILSLRAITQSQHKLLVVKSVLLAVVFLLRFQALRYCGTAAMIIAELSGNVAARFFNDDDFGKLSGGRKSAKLRGLVFLFTGLLLLSVSWDRVECFPSSAVRFGNWGLPGKECVRVWPMLLPFLSGFLGSYERQMMNCGTIKQLGQKRVRLICLLYTTTMLFVPAAISYLVFEGAERNGLSFGNLVWPLANMVVFGVLLSENYSDEKVGSSNSSQREFYVTFACLVVLELFYFPNLSLCGLVICGLLISMAVGELGENYSSYVEIGKESSNSLVSSTLKAVRHILSERKSRKIALFLLINTSYMVVEFVVGFMSNSLGLISDACHMLFDCAALAIGLYASYISRLPANHQFNYGRGRFEVLSGYANAVFLVLVGALIVLESIERILDPQEISTNSLLTVSIGGLVVNMIGLIFFHDEHHHAHGGSGPCSHSHHHDSHSQTETDHQGSDHTLLESHSASNDGHKHVHHHKGHECNHSTPCSEGHGEQISKSSVTHIHQHNQCDHDHHHDHSHNTHHHGHQHRHHEQDSHKHQDGQESSTIHSSDLELVEVHSHRHITVGNHPVESSKNHHHHRHVDHNMEGIFLHVLADTMGSVGVVLSTLLIKYKGWLIADPASSLFISILIVASVIPLLKNSAEILLQRVPRAHEAELKAALENITNIKEVCAVQNMHVWSFTTTEVVGTLHLHVSAEVDKASAKAQVSRILHDAGVKDLTLQVEGLNNC